MEARSSSGKHRRRSIDKAVHDHWPGSDRRWGWVPICVKSLRRGFSEFILGDPKLTFVKNLATRPTDIWEWKKLVINTVLYNPNELRTLLATTATPRPPSSAATLEKIPRDPIWGRDPAFENPGSRGSWTVLVCGTFLATHRLWPPYLLHLQALLWPTFAEDIKQ